MKLFYTLVFLLLFMGCKEAKDTSDMIKELQDQRSMLQAQAEEAQQMAMEQAVMAKKAQHEAALAMERAVAAEQQALEQVKVMQKELEKAKMALKDCQN
jgi:hypothetical protein